MDGIINVVISDTHCGSDRAIFPPAISLPPLMQDEGERLLRYTRNQQKMYEHLINCGEYIKSKFPNHKKYIIHNGDAIEGVHHHTIQLSAPQVSDHVLIHIDIMERFLSAVGFSLNNGDRIFYGSGTETHTGFSEAGIAKHFEPYNAEYYDELRLEEYGRKIWFVHQWVGAGNGANEGNAIANGLKAMYYNGLKEGWDMPDLSVGSHHHKAALGSYSQNFKTFYGMITPSFQMKTRFGQKVSAFQRNDVGLGLIEVAENGMMRVLPPLLMK